MDILQEIAQAARWFMVASFATAMGGAALTALFVIARTAWRS